MFSIGPFIYGDAIVINKAMQSPSIAQYYVKNEGVRLELELSEDNLLKLAYLYPNSTRKIMGLEEGITLVAKHKYYNCLMRDWR